MRSLICCLLAFVPTSAFSQYYHEELQKQKWGTLFYPYFAEEIATPQPHEYTYTHIGYFPTPGATTIDGRKIALYGDPSALYITVYANPTGEPVTLDKERVYSAPANDIMLLVLAQSAVRDQWNKNRASWGRFFGSRAPEVEEMPDPEMIFKDRDRFRRAYFRMVLPGSPEENERKILKEFGSSTSSVAIKNEQRYTSSSMKELFQQPHMKQWADTIIELYELIRPVDLYNLCDILNEKHGNDFTTEMNVVRLFAKFD